jgi:hypothetical protein
MRFRHAYITFFLLLLSIPKVDAQNILDKYIPLPAQELTVEQYLYHIETVAHLYLTYSSDIIENRRIAIFSDSIKIRELLDTLFTKEKVSYIVRGDMLILSPQSEILRQKSLIKISGVIANRKNDKPIPYASIFIPGKSSGTMANSEGTFELILPANSKVDSIIVSSVGYDQEIITSDHFLTGPVEVKLDPQTTLLREVIVRPEDPMKLINDMLERKGENYSKKPAMYKAFFREASKQNDNYISLSEAVIDIYKTSYLTEENDLVRLVKGRRGSNIHESELVNLVVEGGLYNNLQLDIMKYGVSFLDPEYFSNYAYNLQKVITFNDRLTYVISFNFRANIQLPGFDGKLYLDKSSLALVRTEFHLSESSLGQAYSMLVKKVPPAFRIKPKYGNYEVEYRFYDGIWNLSHAHSEIGLKMRKKREHKNNGFVCQFVTSSEFVITGKTSEGFEKIKYRDASKPNDILYQQITDTDPDFWGNETIISPEEPLVETIKKLKIESMTDESKLVTTPLDDQN